MIVFSYYRQFHILQHFRKIDQKYMQRLVSEAGYAPGDIQNKLSTPSSKFWYGFAHNPQELWSLLQQHLPPEENWNWEDNRCSHVITFNPQTYPKGVGFDSLIDLEQLTPDEKKALACRQKNGYTVYILYSSKLIPTWQINVISFYQENPDITTIFPGKFAPPLPDPEYQDQVKYQESKKFWDRHAFVEISR